MVVCLVSMFAGLLGVSLQGDSIKLLRLLRIGRVARMLTALKDLKKILRGCSAAVVSRRLRLVPCVSTEYVFWAVSCLLGCLPGTPVVHCDSCAGM